jgi:hypothetical protein
MLLTSVAVSSFVVAPSSTSLQTGPPPVKVKGPAIIDSDSKSTRVGDRRTSTYSYEVDLATAPTSDMTVTVSDLTNLAQPVGSTLTIPAGSKVGYFTVQAVLPGVDVLVATCSSGTGMLTVTVL